MGRHPFLSVRPTARPSHVQRLHGRARIRRRVRVRRGLRQRAPLERLRADAVAQSDRLGASRRTSDTALCVMGNSLALYNPPTRVAEEFAMIDVISGGRLIAGFPVGTPMDTCYAYGTNPSQLRQRYLEAHDLVVRAWTERDTFAFNGRFNQQRYVNIWPRPVQKPHPPIWVPGGGSVETWHWCAEMNYVYCYLSYYGYKAGRATMDGFWSEMDRLGKP